MSVVMRPNAVSPSAEDTRLAAASSHALLRLLEKEMSFAPSSTVRVSIERANGEKTELALPPAALPLLHTLLAELSQGKNIAVMATDAEITTQQGADFLNVSRPYFVKLLEAGKIPFRKVGSRRRVLLQDVVRYQEQEEAERHRGLDELVAEAQKLEMY